MALEEDCESLHLAAQMGAVAGPPEAHGHDQTQRSILHTHNPEGEEHAISKVSVERERDRMFII